jgi:hypothetical protein
MKYKYYLRDTTSPRKLEKRKVGTIKNHLTSLDGLLNYMSRRHYEDERESAAFTFNTRADLCAKIPYNFTTWRR